MFFYKLSCDMRWGRGTDGDKNKLRGCPEAPRVGAEGSQSHSLFTLLSPNYKMFSRPCVFFLISALKLEEASALSLYVRFRVGSDRP